jgi:Raf kinase inhibitor-like YbhB/YbcL family protein
VKIGFFVVAVLASSAVTIAPAFAALAISSPAFQDDTLVAKTYGNSGNDQSGTRPCGGGGMSPPLTWSGAPAGTQSFAITMYDPDANGGRGFSHWVFYNIPASVTSLAQGDATGPNPKYTLGRNGTGALVYRGPCPPPTDTPHHYVIEISALDLPPNLPAGLDRDGLFLAMQGHTLGSGASIIMLYGH